jgi:hypothetical protein
MNDMLASWHAAVDAAGSFDVWLLKSRTTGLLEQSKADLSLTATRVCPTGARTT